MKTRKAAAPVAARPQDDVQTLDEAWFAKARPAVDLRMAPPLSRSRVSVLRRKVLSDDTLTLEDRKSIGEALDYLIGSMLLDALNRIPTRPKAIETRRFASVARALTERERCSLKSAVWAAAPADALPAQLRAIEKMSQRYGASGIPVLVGQPPGASAPALQPRPKKYSAISYQMYQRAANRLIRGKK